MRSNWFRITAVCLAIVACILAASPAMAQGKGKGNGNGGGDDGGGGDPPVDVQVSYSLTQIGVLGGETYAYDVTQAGTVVGSFSDNAGIERAFVWTSQSGIVDINDVATILVDGQASNDWRLASARGITESGFVAGNAEEIGNPGHYVAYRYEMTTGIAELMTTFSSENHRCADNEPINELGELAYYAVSDLGHGFEDSYHVYVDSPLGLFHARTPNLVNSINNYRQLTGFSFVLQMGDSPMDGVQRTDYLDATIQMVNDQGQFTGRSSELVRNRIRAYRFDPLSDSFDVLDGRKKGSSFGQAINNSGDVAGSLDVGFPAERRPFLYSDEHGLVELDATVAISGNDLTLWASEHPYDNYPIDVNSVTERNATGFPLVLTQRIFNIDGARSIVSFLLTPELP